MSFKNLYTIQEVAETLKVNTTLIVQCVTEGWVIPVDSKTQNFDKEDLARLSLICELREAFGVNERAIPIILHLIDQLHCFQLEMKSRQDAVP